jgi:hypothetical protein
MDFWGKLAARRARRPKIVSTVVPERTFKRSIEPPPNDYGVSYLARILETDIARSISAALISAAYSKRQGSIIFWPICAFLAT